ncbi:hypothetical protein MA16_Dca000218 [Dendrobium catenatum]|uniref:Uncharacterized protein n=1 Tax=Dendrobium catenatum TaxID=906689 RepID=A0A2I0WT87_9ASPA|nr:hypothetical protein MA16_Dca000218 [Dendrobium catenatum]
MSTSLLGRNLGLKPLNSGKVFVWMLVRPKTISILESLCTLILFYTGIIGLRTKGLKRSS